MPQCLLSIYQPDGGRPDADTMARIGVEVHRLACLPAPTAPAATSSSPRSTPYADQFTDWTQVLAVHDQLARLDPGPVAALNRAVAVLEVDGPAAALRLVCANTTI